MNIKNTIFKEYYFLCYEIFIVPIDEKRNSGMGD